MSTCVGPGVGAEVRSCVDPEVGAEVAVVEGPKGSPPEAGVVDSRQLESAIGTAIAAMTMQASNKPNMVK